MVRLDSSILASSEGSRRPFGALCKHFFNPRRSRDYERPWRHALVTMGATDGDVDVPKFAEDLRRVYETLDSIEPTVTIEEDTVGGAARAAVSVDQQQVAQLRLRLACRPPRRTKSNSPRRSASSSNN